MLMNTKTKEILDELIYYKFHYFQDGQIEKFDEEKLHYLKSAHKKLGGSEIYEIDLDHIIGQILIWHKLVFLDIESPDTMVMEDNVFNKSKEFFKLCPKLEEFFVLENNSISWNSSISQEMQEDIRNYIHENYKVPVRIRRRKI